MEQTNKKPCWSEPIKWHDSTQVDETRYYNGDNGVLEVKFKSGGTYHYYGVSKNLYDDMLKSSSGGTFLSQYVKGKYNYKKV